MDDLESEILLIFKDLETNFVSTQLILKTILNFFATHDIIVHKFLLNLTITICLIEEFLKKTDVIKTDKDILKAINMYDVINAAQLDIIAFTRAKNCFKKIGAIFETDMENKFKKYTENITNNKIDFSVNNQQIEGEHVGEHVGEHETITEKQATELVDINKIAKKAINNGKIEYKLFHTLSTSKLTFTSPE